MSEPKQSRLLSRRATYVRLTVTAVLLAWVGTRTDWTKVGAAFATIRLEWWLAALSVLLGTQLASAWRWQIFGRCLGFQRPMRQVVGFYFIGMYFNLLLPTSVGGDVVRAWYLDGGSGRRLAAFATVFLDRVSGLIVLLSLACAGVLLAPLDVPIWVQLFVWASAACALASLALALALAKRGKRSTGLARKFRAALQALRAPKLVVGSTALSLAVQAGNVVIVWLVGKSIHADVPGAYYWIMVPMVSLLTMLPVSINGMGVREGATVLFLAPVGVSEDASVTLALLWFAVFVTGSLVGGVVYLFGRFPRPVVPMAASSETEVDDGTFDRGADQGRARQHQSIA